MRSHRRNKGTPDTRRKRTKWVRTLRRSNLVIPIYRRKRAATSSSRVIEDSSILFAFACAPLFLHLHINAEPFNLLLSLFALCLLQLRGVSGDGAERASSRIQIDPNAWSIVDKTSPPAGCVECGRMGACETRA
jgi:hypothetical protein